MDLIQLSRGGRQSGERAIKGKILLVKPPYFSPWTPPLGIGILKSFLQQHGYSVQCFDFNTDPELWGMHHKYFGTVQKLEDVSINDGYSKLWWILNAHMLAYANGASPEQCARVLETIIPRYGIGVDSGVIGALIPLVDRFYKRLKEVADSLNLSEFAVVGTSTYTTSLGPSLFLLKNVKREFPQVKTVMGGGVFADDLALESDNLNTLIREYDYVDHIILGEGELLLLKLLQGEFLNKRVISLADLKGRTLEMKDVPVPDFSDTEPGKYYHLSIEGARSCPFQCSFCSETIQWGDYRKKPTDQFAEQVIELARRYNNNSFFMGDSLMNPYINPFATKLLEMNANVLYDGYLRADKPVMNRKFVKLWADSGCYRVRLGIESAAARVLESMDKMTTPQVISGVLKTLASAGIRTTTYWIVGFPNETEEDFRETYEFIREHHRFIYELEAHPYYYYPYGQIGSRLHQCYSLYPDEVTDVIKFKVWDIIDANPTREERYSRLRRISKLASDLGLPNIYTMSERYAAERRWHALCPTSAEVFEGTRVNRELPPPLARPLPVFSGAARRHGAQPVGSAAQVLCYQVASASRLDPDVLRAALKTLVQYHEMLQVGLRGDEYVAEPVADFDAKRVLSVYAADGEGQDAETRKREIVEELSAQMRPAPFDSLRVALVDLADETCSLLVLLHRSVSDSRGVVVICEDLLRLYEQLSNQKEIALRAVEKSYSDFVSGLETKSAVVDAWPPPDAGADATTAPGDEGRVEARRATAEIVSLEVSGVTSSLSGVGLEFDLEPSDVILTALQRILARSEAARPFRIDVTADYRAADTSLRDTVAALTLLKRLPAPPRDGLKFPADARALRRLLHDDLLAGQNAVEVPTARGEAILINLEQLVEAAWLGVDQYVPLGILDVGGEPKPPYLLELTPALSGDGLKLSLKYRDAEESSSLAREIADGFGREVTDLLAEGRHYAAAREFWLAELGHDSPQPNVEMLAGDVEGDGGGWASARCDLNRETLERVCARCEADTHAVLLSAFGVLLSRLNGRQRVNILTAIAGDHAADLLPLSFEARWDMNFRGFARRVGRKVSLAREHSDYVSEFTDGRSYVFDVAYLAGGVSSGGGVAAVEALRLRYPSLAGGVTLALNAGGEGAALSVHLMGEGSRFSLATVRKMAAYLEAIMMEVAGNPDVSLSDISLGKARNVVDPSLTLARDAFSFN